MVNLRPTLIHQNHIICKEHTLRDITLYVSCDLIHHQGKEIRAQHRPLMQSYINWKVIKYTKGLSIHKYNTIYLISSINYYKLGSCFKYTKGLKTKYASKDSSEFAKVDTLSFRIFSLP
jgi:hypothetical protein